MAGEFFTNGVAEAAGALVGTERVPLDVAAGGSEWATSAVVAEAVPSGQYAADTSTGSFTATAAEMAGARLCVLDLTGALAGGANVTTPTAGALIAQLVGDGFVGQSWVLRILNNSAGAFAWTLLAGAGVTITGTVIVAQHTWREWLCIQTGAGSVSMQNIGGGTT